MKDKLNYLTQGRAAEPSGKPDKNVSVGWEDLARRKKHPLKRQLF